MKLFISTLTALVFCWWGQLPPHGEFERDWLAFTLLALFVLVLGLKNHLALSLTNPPALARLSLSKPFLVFQSLWLVLALLVALQYMTLPPEVWGGRFLLTLGWLLGASCAAWLGALSVATDGPESSASWRAVAQGLVWGAVVNALVAWAQVMPLDALRALVPAPAVAGRGYGALLQPNLTATLLMVGLVSLDSLLRTTLDAQRSKVHTMGARVVAVLLGSGVAVTGSRVGLLLLLLWSLNQLWRAKRTGQGLGVRAEISVSPWGPLLGLGVVFLATLLKGVDVTTVVERGDALSNGRALIFSHALDIGRAFPWWGSGFGQLSYWHVELPYHPKMPGYLTHAHNLFLQFWAELGVLGVVWVVMVMGVLAEPVNFSFKRAEPAQSERGRWSFSLLLMILLHSMTEMPLWSAPFLLLFGFAVGVWLAPQAHRASPAMVSLGGLVKFGTLGALVATVACVAVYRDYQKVSALYDGTRWSSARTQEVVDRAQTSLLFHPAAEFAAANSAQVNEQTAAAYVRTLPTLWRYVTDPRMFEWQLRASAWGRDTQAFSHHAQRFQWLYPTEYAAFKASAATEIAQLPWTAFSPEWP